MNIKGSGRSALILAAGLLVYCAGSSQAATTTTDANPRVGSPITLNKYTRHSSHHWRRHAHHKSGQVTLKATDDKKAAGAAADNVGKFASPTSEIPPSIANANAQFAASDVPAGDVARPAPTQPDNQLQNTELQNVPPDTETQVVAADQLNDLDRALQEEKPAAAPLAMASAEPPVLAASTVTGSEGTWEKTSLIGKIFIGFGALLTMASAARMFMA